MPENLKGYMKGDTLERFTVGQTETQYELLAKGIGLYNGKKAFNTQSWPTLLSSQVHAPSNAKVEELNKGNRCHSCEYSIKIRHDAGLGYRTYIWQGAPDVDSNGDGQISEDETGWCFAYGEKEWVNPEFTVPDPSDSSKRINASFADYLNRAKFISKYQEQCN